MIPTPIIEGLDFDHVYEPAEDSFLLLDALEQDLDFIRDTLKPVYCVEIGCGSGIISTALACALKNTLVVACDINPNACRATKMTAQVNDASRNVDILEMDFMQCFPLLSRKVDLLVCNPPYVVTEEGETGHNNLFASWAGGAFGRNLTDLLIERLSSMLSEKGVAYIVIEQKNNPEEVRQKVESLSLSAEYTKVRRAGREVLHILKINKNV